MSRWIPDTKWPTWGGWYSIASNSPWADLAWRAQPRIWEWAANTIQGIAAFNMAKLSASRWLNLPRRP